MQIFYSSLLKWAMVIFFCLYVGTAYNTVHAQVNFTKSDLDFNGFGSAPSTTSLTFGPDGRLYVMEYPGVVHVLTVQKNGTDDYVVIAKEMIRSLKANKLAYWVSECESMRIVICLDSSLVKNMAIFDDLSTRYRVYK